MARNHIIDRRAYLKTVGAASGVVAITGCLGDDGDDGDTITPGTASGFPPFEFDDDGELVGFDIDLAEASIEGAGYEVGDWVDIEFDSLIPSLTNGDIDLIAAAMTINDERKETIAFTDPYYEADQGILLQTDADFEASSFEDLEGRRVGAQSGTTGEDIVQEQLIDEGIIDEDDYRAYDNYTLAVNDLEGGAIDAVVIDTPVANTFADSREVEIAFVHETGEEFGFGMRQDDDRIEDVNAALAELREDGTYDDLVETWFE